MIEQENGLEKDGRLIIAGIKAGSKSGAVDYWDLIFSLDQVRLIRSLLLSAGLQPKQIPLVDTVERLQGQQVDMIVLSFCSSSPEYIRQIASFLFNRNRINVMISRAKTKVVCLGCETVLNRILI